MAIKDTDWVGLAWSNLEDRTVVVAGPHSKEHEVESEIAEVKMDMDDDPSDRGRYVNFRIVQVKDLSSRERSMLLDESTKETRMSRIYDPKKFLSNSSRLDEKVQPLPANLSLEEMLEELTKRMNAARKAIGIANKLKNKEEFRKHFSAITGNMNTIRAGINRVSRELERFEKMGVEAPKRPARGHGSIPIHRVDRKKAVNEEFWVVRNAETDRVVSVLLDESKAWDLAERLETVGRRHQHSVTLGSKSDYEMWLREKG